MIETKMEKETKEVEKIVKVKCDFDDCGKEFDEETVFCHGYGQIRVSFGYGSENDGELWVGEICDDCFDELKKILKLRLITTQYGFGN